MSGAENHPELQIRVMPDEVLIDEIPMLRISGAWPGEQLTLTATTNDDNGVEWRSEAILVAGVDGEVDPSIQPSSGGTYRGIDPAGLYWSMIQATPASDPTSFASASLQPREVRFDGRTESGKSTTAMLTRNFISPDVAVEDVRADGLVATLFLPPSGGPAPAVITLGGSGGAMRGASETAALLASHGFVAMSLAYFGMDGLPDHLIEIPLEYFETAITWLRRHEAVDGGKVALSGVSRGGELVLLLGSTFPELIDAIVAWVPSSVLWAGIGPGNSAIGSPSWSYRGKPLPMMPDRVTAEQDRQILGDEPVALTRRYLINLEDRDAVRHAAIPVERIECPLLLISGQDDAMWPSTLMSEMIVERLAEHNHPQLYRHLQYAGAGHGIRAPHLPTTVNSGRHPIRGFLVARGGESAAHARAQREAWPEVLRFLRETLAGAGA